MTEFDEDLLARQEARTLCRRAGQAQQTLETLPQEKLDAIVRAMAAAFEGECASLAKMAVEETGFGNTQDKTEKNRFACRAPRRRFVPLNTVGILREDLAICLWDLGAPVGVIGAIVPSTNPTSTVCYKALIAVKAGCAIVFSPHPKAAKCSCAAARILARAAEAAGAPEGTIACLTKNKMAGTQEMMSAPEVKLLLATGGPGMVRAAYSSGKPAIGVGAGNGPAFIHSSADVPKAVADIIRSKTFDNGTVCASEQSIIVERSMETAVLAEAEKQGIYLMPRDQAGALAKLLFKPGGGLDPQVVGKSAIYLAEKAGFSVPKDTKVLMAREQEAGPTRPYSMEKLCPVLAFFVMDSEEAVLSKAVEVLRHEGSGHTFAIHARDEEVIRRFALKIPVSRFLVNAPAALGGIGAATGLFPALTLGCGAVGGSSSSNNISPLDLINIRRVAWGRKEEPRIPQAPDSELVELLTQKILERLG